MRTIRRALVALMMLASCVGGPPPHAFAPDAVKTTPAPPHVVADLQQAVEWARQRFEARDAAGVLTVVSEHYRSSGMTKAAVRQQLVTMFTLYQELRAKVTIDEVQTVDGATWVYTSGEVTGRLPLVGWVAVLTWQREPEVARREATGWRLFGFQD